MAPRLNSFTDAEHAHMWRFIAEEFKQKNFIIIQRYGDLLWEKYIKAGHSERTLHSLRSHFGRQMYPRMHMANLPKDELFGLLKHFRVTLTDQQVKYLEEKFRCEVRRNSLGIIVLPSDIEDHHVLPRKRSSDGQLPLTSAAMQSTVPSRGYLEDVRQAPKKPRVKQETDDDELIPLAASTPMDVDATSNKYGELVRGRTLKVLAGQLTTDAIFDCVPSGIRRRHEEFAVLLKSLVADCARPQMHTAIPERATHSASELRYVEDVKPSVSARRAEGSKRADLELLRQQIAAAQKEVERYDSTINAVKHELYDIVDAKERLSR
ncbi:hypothetical protein AAVH_26863 [Aphelenchoides avenae]|nr:hypothetical protein AAVH_26863 [Aphelenchus avenae]